MTVTARPTVAQLLERDAGCATAARGPYPSTEQTTKRPRTAGAAGGRITGGKPMTTHNTTTRWRLS